MMENRSKGFCCQTLEFCCKTAKFIRKLSQMLFKLAPFQCDSKKNIFILYLHKSLIHMTIPIIFF